MTLEIIEARITQAMLSASQFAARCNHSIVDGDLATALKVCRDASIDPPHCSLTAKSVNAERLRDAAGKKLSDSAWWKKALEKSVLRQYESEQFAQGKITNYVSDGLASYNAKQKQKR